MRRLLGFALLLAFSLPLISPLLAAAQDPDAGLPICCRRNGKHHCMMDMAMMRAMEADGNVYLLAPTPHCPMFPAVAGPMRHSDLALHHASLIFAEIISHPAVKAQTLARARIARDRGRQKRGPPTELL